MSGMGPTQGFGFAQSQLPGIGPQNGMPWGNPSPQIPPMFTPPQNFGGATAGQQQPNNSIMPWNPSYGSGQQQYNPSLNPYNGSLIPGSMQPQQPPMQPGPQQLAPNPSDMYGNGSNYGGFGSANTGPIGGSLNFWNGIQNGNVNIQPGQLFNNQDTSSYTGLQFDPTNILNQLNQRNQNPLSGGGNFSGFSQGLNNMNNMRFGGSNS